MLFAAGVALFLCLYRYVEKPNRVWTYATFFFLAHFLSDYYWTIYILVMNNYPDTSAMFAYFGWNLTFVFMFLMLWLIQGKEEKKFFHPLMLVPIPLNIAQFCLYLPYGGLFNNIWQGLSCTAIACVALQSLLCYWKNRKNGAKFPMYHFLAFLYMVSEYGMWTSSCFTFENQFLDPYYYFSFLGCTVCIFLPWAIRKSYETQEGEDDGQISPRFQMVFQVIVAFIICVCCAGGYLFAGWMKNRLAGSIFAGEEPYGQIAFMLFGVSVILDMIILALMLGVHSYFKNRKGRTFIEEEIKGKFNFVFTLSITFLLMLFAVIYTSRLLYDESVSSLYGDCEEQIAGVATSLSNYLGIAEAVLWVTGDSVDQMMQNGIDIEKIHDYLRVETEHQSAKFDENFTGIYGVIEGTYLDGLDWEPPEGYDPVQRDWYIGALKADGDVLIVPPYVDAQTGAVIISFSKMLSDGQSVLSLDVTLDHVQETVADININGNGYGMVLDRDGMIISHYDRSMNGQYCSKIFGNNDFLNALLSTKSGRAEVVIDGEKHMLFTNEVLGQWYTVVLVKNRELLSEVRVKLLVNICVYMIIFFLITFFYYISYMNEQNASRMMEELITERQKQEYESKVLKLEKSAADDANKAKSRFLADMSHEIRTPINAVLGMNEMIIRETESENIREYADNIRTSGRALLSLINSILDFSKIEDGKMEIIPVDYRTVDMIHYLQNSVAERAAAKGLAFHVDVDSSIPSVLHGDDMRVSQVIMNLLSNAVKYTKEGEVCLTVKNMGCDGDAINLMVEVKDTGIGILQEDMPKLFESFERLDKEKNRNIEGTGLGMSIVTKLLTMMGSELSVESEYGVGSKFYFVISQGVVDKTEVGDSYVSLSEGAKDKKGRTYQEAFHAPDASILIVDDTKMNLTVATNLLKKTMVGIDTSLSGEDALKLCEKKKYDVIFMDQRMPGLDGTQTLSLIRKQEGGLNIQTPVICLTADAISGARDRYLAEGFSDYLTKPIDSHELESMLLRYLPKEKVKMGNAPEGEKEKAVEARTSDGEADWMEKYACLKDCGIDLETALMYSQGDEEVFGIVITEYVRDAADRAEKLKGSFEAKDWKNYAVYVHSLKSSSKMIGAMGLSEVAASLEAAANEMDVDTVENVHEGMMEQYRKLVEDMKRLLGIAGSDGSESDFEDGEVMEFLPE